MIEVQVKGIKGLLKQLSVVRSPGKRKRILKKVGRYISKQSKHRITAQTDLGGKSFEPRADGRRRKLLTKNVRKMLKVIESTDTLTTVGYKNSFTGRLAAKHQRGFSETVNKRTMRARSKLKSSDPATRKQAKELRELGYKKRRASGRGYQRPTIKWVTKNLTVGKASAIIHEYRTVKETWKITVPARSFLGVTENDIKNLSELIQEEIELVINTKNHK